MFSPFRATWLPAILLAGLSSLQPVFAQVTTDCNPMEKDCPDNPAFGTEFLFNFNSSPPLDTWEKTAQGEISYDAEKGAIFRLSKQGDSPTLRTKFYFFGGRTEIMMRCAPGTGIISSMMWLSDTLDEVDWEFFGTNATFAASNYFGKGAEDFTNGEYHSTGFDVYQDYHNYTTIWTKEKLEWWIDGRHVRTLLSNDANNHKNFPQTPMRLSLGIWAGGDPRLPEGTRDWAGGTTNYDEGPFEMYIKSVKVEDFSKDSKTFIYGDRSGMWDSIEIVG
jgi:beta-glucanase (GH16 family)